MATDPLRFSHPAVVGEKSCLDDVLVLTEGTVEPEKKKSLSTLSREWLLASAASSSRLSEMREEEKLCVEAALESGTIELRVEALWVSKREVRKARLGRRRFDGADDWTSARAPSEVMVVQSVVTPVLRSEMISRTVSGSASVREGGEKKARGEVERG